jgi:hypothetical protein
MLRREETAELSTNGWHKLVKGFPWFTNHGKYLIAAYSEFMPPTRLHLKPYGDVGIPLFEESDPYGWRITEAEEAYEIRPGLEHLANSILSQLVNLGQGRAAYRIAGHMGRNLTDNPYWPPELAAKAGQLAHERYVTLLPLSLSRTQDDKSRVRWTLFGSSEQGPERAFWQSFYTAPGQERPTRVSNDFIRRLLITAYGEKIPNTRRLYASGFRVLPSEPNERFPYWRVNPLPSWTRPYLVDDNSAFEDVHYLLTFRPFSSLPSAARERYLAGRLCLLPFPGSLVFWGMQNYIKLQEELPMAMQATLLRTVEHRNDPNGFRVPQSGWLNEPKDMPEINEVQKELLANAYYRLSRWDRVYRWEDETKHITTTDRVSRVLFSTAPDILGLYDKPMARNAQIWTEDSKLLLDGPHATHEQLLHAAQVIDAGGNFRYRFIFPAMNVGRHEVYWHLPLIAYWHPSDTNNPFKVILDALLGYLTAYISEDPDLAHPIELWPRILNRPSHHSAITHFSSGKEDLHPHQTPLNIIRLLDNYQMWGKQPLPRDFARQLLRLPKQESIDEWLANLPERSDKPIEGRRMQRIIAKLLEKRTASGKQTGMLAKLKVKDLPPPLTFTETKGRDFEVAYWKEITNLAHGKYRTKDNADVAQDDTTLKLLGDYRHRDLEDLGDYLLQRHRQTIAAAGMEGQALVGELPFYWHTDFDFPLFGGWKNNHEGHTHECDLLVVIPGKDRNRAVIMADHYDTAYMEDIFKNNHARLAANGADDNFSATATLLLAAPVFLKLAEEGRLAHDVWLVHLTGEEFPADSMGARHLAQAIIERTLKLCLQDGNELDLSSVNIVGICVLDMIAHNKESEQNIFQISPGDGVNSLKLAYQAHIANMLWNAWATEWNKSERPGKSRSKRSSDPEHIPDTALYAHLEGQVRTPDDPLSSLFNTDGQIFSDIGVPTVLFMENYDINRQGYHDTHDTVENIDLDYGSALSRIAIEAVARIAAEAK